MDSELLRCIREIVGLNLLPWLLPSRSFDSDHGNYSTELHSTHMDSGSSSKERATEERDVVEFKKALATGAAGKEEPVASAAGMLSSVYSAPIDQLLCSFLYYLLLRRVDSDDYGQQSAFR